MKNQNYKVPEEVIQTFKEWMSPKIVINPSEIVCFPDDGYRDFQHGTFDLYVLRHDGVLYRVRYFSDGTLIFGNN